MPKLYDMIEEQINILLRFMLEDEDTGEIQYGGWIKGPRWIRPIIYFVSLIIYILITLYFGLYLWNQGLHVAFPGVVAHIGPGISQQLKQPYSQLVVTLISMLLIF